MLVDPDPRCARSRNLKSVSTGVFITFEGGEGSGKSTQARRVAAARDAVLTRQPGGTAIGVSVRQLLLSNETQAVSARAEALLMAADRAQHVEELIRPSLAAGSDVVCDRYAASSLAYQGAGRELGIEEVLALSTFAVDGLWPDLTVLIDVPVDVGLGRIGGAPDRLESQGTEFHERVRQAFLGFAAADPTRWVVVDGTKPLDVVSAAVDAAIADRLTCHE